MRKVLAALILFCYPLISFAQNQKEIDSLETLLHTRDIKDSIQIDIYNNLGFLYRSTDKDKAAAFLDSAIFLATLIGDDEGLSGAYNRYGILYKNKGLLDKAILYYDSSINIAKKINNIELVADVTNNLGNLYRLQGNHVKAAEVFLNTLKLREQSKDIGGMASAHNNLAYVYTDIQNFQLATKNNLKSIELFAQAKDSFELARAYGYMGFIHYFQSHFDSAIHYCSIGLTILKTLGDKYETAALLNNMGNIQAESGSPIKGIPYHEQALQIQIDTKDSVGIFTSYLSLAQTYLIAGKYNKAESYANKAVSILDNISAITQMYKDTYLLLSEIHKKGKNYHKAYDALATYNRYKDSLVNADNNRLITEMQEKYESDKKDLLLKKNALELNNANIELKQKNIITITLITLLIVILLIIYLLYNRYKLKKQQELDQELIRQKDLRSIAIIDAEEKERTRIAKDLHDGIGQQLSAAKLAINALDNLTDEEKRNEKIGVLSNMLDESIKDVRAVSHSMMPSALYKLGLSSAIREFVQKISATGAIKADLEIVGLDDSLNKTTEIILYRVIQELVNNTIKHAQAKKVMIQMIKHDNDMLNIIVEDDGIGFNTKDTNNVEGIGLKNIQSRIEYINGDVVFDSTSGKGTTVIIDVPLKS